MTSASSSRKRGAADIEEADEQNTAKRVRLAENPPQKTQTPPAANPRERIKKLTPVRPFPTVPTSVSATGPRSAHKEGKNFICLTRKTSLSTYMRRCKDVVLKDGMKTLHLSAMGAAIPHLMQLIAALPPILPFSQDDVHVDIRTGTVEVRDEISPKDEDEDVEYRTRGKSSLSVVMKFGDGETEQQVSGGNRRRRHPSTKSTADTIGGQIIMAEPEQEHVPCNPESEIDDRSVAARGGAARHTFRYKLPNGKGFRIEAFCFFIPDLHLRAFKMKGSAFLLLDLPSATLASPFARKSGTLGIQCVTTPDEEVFLVLHLDDIEYPIDPSSSITVTESPTKDRLYTFPETQSYAASITVTLARPANPDALRDVETFEALLTQYAAALRGAVLDQHEGLTESPITDYPIPTTSSGTHSIDRKQAQDLRGRLVLVNQDNGDVVGEFDSKLKVNEDPKLGEKGHENDAVVIEIPDDTSGMSEEHPLQLFASAIPPEQQNWMTKGATVVSHAISGTTNLLVTVISGASSHYIATSRPVTPDPSKPPSRVAVLLSSERTRKGISNVHAFTGQAVKVSSKTMGLIDDIVHKAVGKSEKPAKATPVKYSGSPIERTGPPPPYATYTPQPRAATSLAPFADGKPGLPPRRSPSPTPLASTSSTPPPPLPPRNVGLIKRAILSADLIFSTLEYSGKQLLDVGSESLGNIAGHRYGPAAGENVRNLTGTAKNVAVVYVDMRGIGRRALIKKAGKHYAKSHFSSSEKK